MSIQPAVTDFEPVQLGHHEIIRLIPHRPPFLFIGSAIIIADRTIEGSLLIEPSHCAGHFEGSPLFPGVLMCEMAFQAAGVLVGYRRGGPVKGVAARLQEAEFKGLIQPGQTITMRVTLLKEKMGFISIEAAGRVDGQLVFSSKQLISGHVPLPTPAS